MATVVVLGALDTKGEELRFLTRQIEDRGHRVLVVDVGVLGEPAFTPFITRDEVATAAGASLTTLASEADRGRAVTAMSRGASVIAQRLLDRGELDAVIAMGGGAGTSIGTAAMRALPLGIPKVMVSTLASGDVRGFVGVKDITMIPAIVDISGLNRISRGVFTRAAGAVCGMVESSVPPGQDAPTIVASMFGNTTPCVETARAILEKAGFEVLVFHATGSGGQTMESLIEARQVAGVLDVTTPSVPTSWWASSFRGTARPAAAKTGRPVMPRGASTCNFWVLRHPDVSRPRLISTSKADARPHDTGRKRRAGAHHRRQAERIDRAGRGVPAASRHLRDLGRGKTLPLAGSGRRVVRLAAQEPEKGHTRARNGLSHQ